MTTRERGQAEVIGTVLLAAVLVVTVSVVGFFLLEQQSDRIEGAAPSAAFETEFRSATLTISHAGGERFRLRDLDLVIGTGSESRYDLEAATPVRSDGDEYFERGEAFRITHSASGEARILLADTSPGGHVLYDETKRPTSEPAFGSPTVEALDVDDTSTISQARYEIVWRASDNGDDVTSATLELLNSDTGAVEDRESYSFSETGDTGSQTATLRNESGVGEVYEIRLTVTDADGNVVAVSDFDRSEIDTTPPTISNFAATNPQTTDINVSFDSDESLSEIAVEIRKNNDLKATLTENEFSVDRSSGYTYVATYAAGGGGTYNATLVRAEDGNGNDGADGQSDTVRVSGGGGGGGGGGNNTPPGQGGNPGGNPGGN